MSIRHILFILTICTGFALAVAGTSPNANARVFKKMDVPEGLQSHLNDVLKSADDLHNTCMDHQDEQIDLRLDGLISSLNKALQQTRLVGAQKTHLDRILNTTEAAATKARGQRGEQRIESLKETFKQLVQIDQVFHLDNYNIFFCDKDRSVWIQKSKRPANPIHPREFKSCGKQVQ